MQWLTLFQKELRENWHNKKWIWVPLVMIILTIMDPLSYYYLPEIIDLAGGVPEGTVFDVPKMVSTEVIMMSLDQLSMFGVMIIVLISMRTIAGERNNGIGEIILVKPISGIKFLTSKWVAFSLLVYLSLFISLLTSWYYINLLYGEIAFTLFLKIFFFYSLWFIFVLTVNFFYNTLVKSPGLVVGCTIITLFVLSIINIIFGHKLTWFPNKLSEHIYEMSLTNEISSALIGTSILLVMLIMLLLIASIYIFNKQEKVH